MHRLHDVEGSAGAAAGPAHLLHYFHRTHPAAYDSGVRGDDRRQKRAGRDCGCRSQPGQPGAGQPVQRVRNFFHRRRGLEHSRGGPVPRERKGLDGACDSARLRKRHCRRAAVDAANRRGRFGCQLHEHRDGVCHQSHCGLRAGSDRRADARSGIGAVWRRHRPSRARVVQPDDRKPLLHAARHFRAAAARGDVQSLVDGHRTGARSGHPRAVERHTARASTAPSE